jgi:hypothetical protein
MVKNIALTSNANAREIAVDVQINAPTMTWKLDQMECIARGNVSNTTRRIDLSENAKYTYERNSEHSFMDSSKIALDME